MPSEVGACGVEEGSADSGIITLYTVAKRRLRISNSAEEEGDEGTQLDK